MYKLLILVLIIFFPSYAGAQAFWAKVISVSDGDTITVLQNNSEIRVRLFGIDCPEKSQAFGSVARKKTNELLYGKMAYIQPQSKDQYGRMVSIVSTEDGVPVADTLLQLGLAWHYEKFSGRLKSLFSELQASAQASRLGLWSEPNPIPPWEFRH